LTTEPASNTLKNVIFSYTLYAEHFCLLLERLKVAHGYLLKDLVQIFSTSFINAYPDYSHQFVSR